MLASESSFRLGSAGHLENSGELTGTDHRQAGPLAKGSFTTEMSYAVAEYPRLRFSEYLRESASDPGVRA